MIIVKLGGSIITDKSRYRTFRKRTAARIIKELAQIDEPMAIVHGGGSFGHIMAKEYSLPGPITEKSRIGASIIHKDMVDLDQLIMSILLENGISAISFPPSTYVRGNEKGYATLEAFLEAGMTPVSFGDIYLRSSNEIGIYSGDNVMLDLAERLKPSRAVFISDVDGLYDRNPKLHKDAKLLRSIYDEASFELSVADVTGGIKGKIDTIKKMKEFVPEIYLLNGAEPERLRKIGTKDFLGTMIS